MKLNRLGRAGMNNPARAFAQRHYVAPLFERLGGRTEGGHVLEVGCGRGVGIGIILDRFGAHEVEAFDLDPAMIARAGARWAAQRETVHVAIGNVAAIDAPDGAFDAVFDFGAIHLVPEWRAAVAEVRRVLHPGGRFYFEELAGRLVRWPLPLVVADRRRIGFAFSREEFCVALEAGGFTVRGKTVTPVLAPLTGLIGDLIGVATAA